MLARRRVDPVFDSAMIYSREENTKIAQTACLAGEVWGSTSKQALHMWQKAEYENCGE